MARTSSQMVVKFGCTCRDVAVLVISGIYRSSSVKDINAAIKSRPVREQVLITCGVLATLFLLSLAAAQVGWIAMLLFWLAVILIVN